MTEARLAALRQEAESNIEEIRAAAKAELVREGFYVRTTFQQRHFEAIAAVLKDCVGDVSIPLVATRDVAYKLASMFKRDNPKFDRDRFLKACNL